MVIPTDEEYQKAFDDEEEDHRSFRLPKLPAKIWEKMSDAQKEYWFQQIKEYEEALIEERRQKDRRAKGY